MIAQTIRLKPQNKTKPTKLVQGNELDSLAVGECLSGEAMASDRRLLPSGS